MDREAKNYSMAVVVSSWVFVFDNFSIIENVSQQILEQNRYNTGI
jgi:hypothetical protein